MRTKPYTFAHESPVIESGIDNEVIRKAYEQERRRINKAKLELINNPVITNLA